MDTTTPSSLPDSASLTESSEPTPLTEVEPEPSSVWVPAPPPEPLLALPNRQPLQDAVHAALDTQAKQLVVFDMDQRSSITDYVVICSGRSQTHVQGIASKVLFGLKQKGIHVRAVEGEREGTWILMDYDTVLLHIFHPDTRLYYNLEGLLKSYSAWQAPAEEETSYLTKSSQALPQGRFESDSTPTP